MNKSNPHKKNLIQLDIEAKFKNMNLILILKKGNPYIIINNQVILEWLRLNWVGTESQIFI